ncbi:MAG TPA: N-acetylglucosamine-6-phosphate deacetylase [Firmicutes bacterium]|nr:N-acetylglucosamine-6-phosphate deacetylase [Bacillota bacterium]
MDRTPFYLTNVTAITPERTINDAAIEVNGGKIAGIFSSREVKGHDRERTIDCKGFLATPGFIDIHVHGGGGSDLMDGNVDAIINMSKAHARHGTTTIVPSTLTSSMEDLFKTLDDMKEARKLVPGVDYAGARIAGIHLEGPYFSPAMCGAQDPRYIKNPEPAEYTRILDYSNDIIRVSAAPELPGALELGRELKKRGILASMGHSDALFDIIPEAVEAGYSHVTHLYSAMSTVRRIQAFRHAGLVEAGLLLDELTVEIIADGKHLPAALLKLIYKCKGPDKIALVTDAMRAAGMPEGKYILGGLRDGQEVIVEDGVAKLLDRSAFAGSVATTNRLVRTMVTLAEVSLRDAIKMATTTPASIIGISRNKGRLYPGMDADIVVFDHDINVLLTMVEGRVVYRDEKLS